MDQIKALANEGHADREIATKLGRTEDGERNIRHRMKIKNTTKTTIHSLKDEKDKLKETVTALRWDVKALRDREEKLLQANRIENEALSRRLQTILQRLKYEKPKLFHVSGEEQLARIAGQLAGPLLKWLISGN